MASSQGGPEERGRAQGGFCRGFDLRAIAFLDLHEARLLTQPTFED